MQKIQKLLFLPIIALLFFLLPVAEAAAEAKLKLSATAGFDNKVKYSHGLPLIITVTNSGDAFSGDLVIDYTESYAIGSALVLPVEIGAGETKTMELSLAGFSDQHMYSGSNFQMFHFYEGGWENGKSIDYKGNKNVKVNMFDPATSFIVTLSNSADRVKALTNVNIQSGPYNAGKQVIHLGHRQEFIFPSDQEAWSSADVMIIDEYVLSDLDEDQQTAILGWIQNGGIAVIGASENTVAEMGILGGHLPLNLSTDRVTVAPEFFTEHSNGSKFNEAISVLEAEVAPNSYPILVGPDSVLAAGKSVGNGTILQTAFSIGDEPLSTQQGYANFLSELLKKINKPAATTNNMYGQSVKETMSWEIGNVNELFPSFKVSTPIIIGIIVIYILLVGPLMYFLLKRKDKREHAWWIIPAVSIITSIGIFAYGAKDRIVKPQIQQTSLLEVNEDGSLSGYYMESLLSNRSGEFSFIAPKDTTMTASLRSNFGMMPEGGSFQKSVLEPGANQSTLTLRNVGYWSVNSILGQTFIPDAGKLAIDLKVENETVTGTVTNEFPFSLKQVSIWTGSKFIDLGELAPNATLQVNEKLGSAIMPPAGTAYSMNTGGYQQPSTAAELIEARKNSAISLSATTVGSTTDPAIVAYTEDAIIPIELKDQRSELSAVNVIMQTFKPETVMSGEFTIPSTSLGRELTSVSSGGYAEPLDGGRLEWFLEEGDYTMKWSVPENMPLDGVEWTELQVVNTSSNSITVQIKNVKTDEMEEVPNGKRHTIEQNVQDYITAEGTIELLIHKDMANGDPHTKVPEIRLKGAVQ